MHVRPPRPRWTRAGVAILNGPSGCRRVGRQLALTAYQRPRGIARFRPPTGPVLGPTRHSARRTRRPARRLRGRSPLRTDMNGATITAAQPKFRVLASGVGPGFGDQGAAYRKQSGGGVARIREAVGPLHGFGIGQPCVSAGPAAIPGPRCAVLGYTRRRRRKVRRIDLSRTGAGPLLLRGLASGLAARSLVGACVIPG